MFWSGISAEFVRPHKQQSDDSRVTTVRNPRQISGRKPPLQRKKIGREEKILLRINGSIAFSQKTRGGDHRIFSDQAIIRQPDCMLSSIEPKSGAQPGNIRLKARWLA